MVPAEERSHEAATTPAPPGLSLSVDCLADRRKGSECMVSANLFAFPVHFPCIQGARGRYFARTFYRFPTTKG